MVGVVRDGRLLLDCRTLSDAEMDEVAAAVALRTRMSTRAPESLLWNALRGALGSRALAIVADLGVAQAARRRPAPGRRGGARGRRGPDTLHRLLRALASDGVFAEERAGSLSQHRRVRTARRRRLGSDSRTCSAASGYHAVGGLDASGKAGVPGIYETDFWSWLAAHPGERSVFDTAMEQGKEGRVERLGRVEWREDETVVDVGGGNGSLLVELLERRPGLQGIVFDLPETVRDEEALGGRIAFVAGSFFESVPEGDAYVLSTILHDWDDERAAAILRTIREGAPPGRPSDPPRGRRP